MITDNTEDLLPRGIELINREYNRRLFHIHVDWKLGDHEDYYYAANYIEGDSEPIWELIQD